MKKPRLRNIPISAAMILFAFIAMTEISESKEAIKIDKIINLGQVVNSNGDDFSPSLTADGRTLVFSSKAETEKAHHIYMSRMVNGKWTEPEFMREINSNDNDETPFISDDGTILLFSSDRPESQRPTLSDDGTQRTTFDIYISYNIDGSWTKPVPIPGEVNTTINERSPSLSPDKQTLYYSQWPYRNVKRARIMQARLVRNEYVEIEELPEPVNTRAYDLALMPSNKRSGFYFSSIRTGGFGGWDLYYVSYHDEKYSDVINLGPKINSNEDEMFLSEAGDRIYFCSNRPGGYGGYDIYYAELPEEIKKQKKREPVKEKAKEEKPVVPAARQAQKISISVMDSVTGKPAQANIRIGLINSEDQDDEPDDTISRKTDTKGKLEIQGRQNTGWVYVEIFKTGYRTYRENHRIERNMTSNIAIRLTPEITKEEEQRDKEENISTVQERGKKTKEREEPVKELEEKREQPGFKPVYFSFNSYRIRSGEYPGLKKILTEMRNDKKMNILITGHADIWGTYEANNKISYRRAYAIRNYFVKMGIDPCRIKIKAAGARQPVIKSRTKQAGIMNRRAEITVIE